MQHPVINFTLTRYVLTNFDKIKQNGNDINKLQANEILDHSKSKAVSETDASKEDGKEEKSSGDNNDEKEVSSNGSHPDPESGTSPGGQTKGRAYLEKVNERKRTWDYFEINHPKAISDKKLEQLKEKYTRRKTEASLLLEKKKEEREVRRSLI